MTFKEFTNKKIFCDMDGVLCDFALAFSRLDGSEGLTPKQYEEKYGNNTIWDIITPEGVSFWENLPWMPDGKELWNFIIKYDPTILTAASKHINSCIGKELWCKRELPELRNFNVQKKAKAGWDGVSGIIMNPDKFKYCNGPNYILIDDTPKKINPWRAAGGVGILHTSAAETIEELKNILF